MSESLAELQLTSNSPDNTLALGESLGKCLSGGLVVALIGSLGAGKTQLVKGVAKGTGSADPEAVTSPTFNLVHEYAGSPYLYHIDAYRLTGAADLLSLGLDEMISDESVVLIEWADRVLDALPEEMLWVYLTSKGEHARHLEMKADCDLARRCLGAMSELVG